MQPLSQIVLATQCFDTVCSFAVEQSRLLVVASKALVMPWDWPRAKR